MMIAGEVIKMMRKEVRWSQAYLAAEMRCARTYLAGVESGRRAPGLRFLRTAARALGVPVALLLVGER